MDAGDTARITNPQGIPRILVIHSFQPSILFSRFIDIESIERTSNTCSTFGRPYVISIAPIGNRIDYGFEPYTHGFIKPYDSPDLNQAEKSEPSQDDTDQPLLLAPKILPFPKELELDLFSSSIQEFLCVSTTL
ncbi:hypothetical protein CXB51_005612 [Gossypium anomalum]|uniref:Uncharacterized protein n=1 Tax=Gossypium anomalum TaxID=47600 RepID=A0A8J5ZCB3_9ROSI|nr:hypothetical protein CXB51_005612 [Gossypium anomalum]